MDLGSWINQEICCSFDALIWVTSWTNTESFIKKMKPGLCGSWEKPGYRILLASSYLIRDVMGSGREAQ